MSNWEKTLLMGVRVTVDWEKDEITAKETGRKTPLFKGYKIDNRTCAEALREAAYWLLERAAGMETQEIATSDEIKRQAYKMFDDHRLGI